MKRDNDYGPYMLTLYLEAMASLLRILPSFFPAAFLFGIGGVFFGFGLQWIGVLGAGELDPWIGQYIMPIVIAGAVIIAFLPVALSVLALAGMPGGYGLTAREMDARPPEDEEPELLLSAQRQILWSAPEGTIGPTRWLVIDNNEPNAQVVGTTIYVNRGLLESEYLGAVLAHELGHVNQGDGSLILALRRFVPPPLSFISFEALGCLPLLLMAFGGGLDVWLTTPAWNRYWQKREFLADRFAFECGQATGLIEFLRLYQFFDVAVPFGFLRRTHPHNAERIDRLNKYLREEDVVSSRKKPERVETRPQLFAGKVPTEQKRPIKERRRGYTDVEAAIDLVFLSESHVRNGDPERIAAEKTWIRENGRRVVDEAYTGNTKDGAGIVYMFWLGDLGRERQYTLTDFTYYSHEVISEVLDGLKMKSELDLDPVIKDTWTRIVETHDPEQSVVVMILNWDSVAGMCDLDYYLVGMPGGAPLLKASDPTLGSLPANERGGGS